MSEGLCCLGRRDSQASAHTRRMSVDVFEQSGPVRSPCPPPGHGGQGCAQGPSALLPVLCLQASAQPFPALRSPAGLTALIYKQ